MIPSARAALREGQLYGILDLGYVRSDQAFDLASKILAGGVQVLQLRAKDQPRDEILFLARGLAELCRQWRVPFILNDHPELVLESEADGAHVGQDDTSVAEARKLAGEHALIGKSTHSLAQALAAQEEKPDYIGFGPLFATPTKPDYAPIGLHDIRAVHQLVALPIFCIGGIKRENLPEVIAAGTRRVVIVSGIVQATDPQAYCEDCRHILARPGVMER